MGWATPDISMYKIAFNKLVYLLPVLILIGAFPFFFLGGSVESSSSLLTAIWDCGHLVFFAALVVFLGRKYDVNSWRFALLLSTAVFVVGGLIELIQSGIGRDGSWDDLVRDLTGTWLGLFWMQRSSKIIWVGRVVSVLLAFPTLMAVFFETWYEVRARQEFPLLVGFESPIESYWGKKEDGLSSEFYSQGKSSLRVQLTPKIYSGIKFSRLRPDWRGFKRFGFDIYNPSETPFSMTVRINDAQHGQSQWAINDRFNATFIVNPGWNHLRYDLANVERAPEGRLMDLSHISWVEIFVGKLPEKRVIYLDNLRLE